MHKRIKHLIKNIKDLAFDTQVSKQSLDKRFNAYSVKFMQEIYLLKFFRLIIIILL